MPAIALFAVIVLSLASVGVLPMARGAGRVPHAGQASGTRLTSPTPSPIYLPTTAQLSALSEQVVWALIASSVLFRSTDQGNTWQLRPLPALSPVTPPQSLFVNDHEGWLLSVTYLKRAAMRRRSCGSGTRQMQGQPWRQLTTTGLASMQCEEEISFVDSASWIFDRHDPNHRPTIY